MYLTKEQLRTNLSVGKAIEQWIGFAEETNYTVLKWLRIDKENDNTFSVAYFEVFDEGNLNFLDIYEFSPIDPDEPYGIINTYNNLDEVLEFVKREYNANDNNFVNSGMIQEEYRKYLELK